MLAYHACYTCIYRYLDECQTCAPCSINGGNGVGFSGPYSSHRYNDELTLVFSFQVSEFCTAQWPKLCRCLFASNTAPSLLRLNDWRAGHAEVLYSDAEMSVSTDLSI